MKVFDKDTITSAWESILTALGIDYQNDPNFTETPKRITAMYDELLAGLLDDDLSELEEHITKTFPSSYDQMIAIGNIEAWGMCPHHFLPVRYTINVGYLPDKDVLGLSKLPRVVKLLARRPVLQEQLTDDIVDYLDGFLKPRGSIVQVAGYHHCMIIRGACSESPTYTSQVRGAFKEHPTLKSEFESLIRR